MPWRSLGRYVSGGGGGGGTPGGANTNVQFNNAGAFAGSANLTWDGTNFHVAGNYDSSGRQRWLGFISPAALGPGETDDYSPPGLAGAAILRLTTDVAGSQLGGIAAQPNGTRLIVYNVGNNALTLLAFAGGSAAANQILAEVDLLGGPTAAIELIYDSAAQGGTGGWQPIGVPFPVLYYQRVQNQGVGVTQRPNLSFNNGFVPTDSALGGGRTNIAVGANADGSIVVNAHDLQVGVLATDAQHGARGGGTQHANAVAAGAAGFMTGADKTKLDGIGTGANVISVAGKTGVVTLDHAADLANVGTNTHAQIDTFIASKAAASGLASLDANSRLVQHTADKGGQFVSVSTTQTLGTTQPLSLTDATMAAFAAGGSTTMPGTVGAVAASFAANATETGAAAGQAGLGANNPLTDSAYAGQRIPVRFKKANGNDLLVADILAVVPLVADTNSAVYAYLAYRSDLGANAHWRVWFYYKRNSDGVEIAVTPTISVTNATVFVPAVYYDGDLTISGDFNVDVIAGERAAEIAPQSIMGSQLVNNTVTATQIANLTITDAQVAAANKDGAAGTASMRTLSTTATTACAGNDARLSDSRAPNGSAGGDLTGTYPNPTIATTADPQLAGLGIATAGVANAIAMASATAPSTPAGNILQLHNTVVFGNRATLHAQTATYDDPFILRYGRRQAGFRPIINGGSAITGESFGWTATTAGTISHPAPADTDYGTRQVRTRFTSGTGANAFAGISQPGGAGVGTISRNAGFLIRIRFRFNNAAQANNNSFVGIHDVNNGVNDPTTHTSAMGIGWVNADVAGNLFIIHTDGAGVLTKTDLGSNAPRDAATVYELTVFAKAADSQIGFRLVNLTTNVVVSDQTVTTNIAAAATFTYVDTYVECGSSGVAAVLDIIQIDEVYY